MGTVAETNVACTDIIIRIRNLFYFHVVDSVAEQYSLSFGTITAVVQQKFIGD